MSGSMTRCEGCNEPPDLPGWGYATMMNSCGIGEFERRIWKGAAYLWMMTRNEMLSYMKPAYCTLFCLMALGLADTFGQQPSPPTPAPPPVAVPAPAPPPGGQFSQRLQNIIGRASAPPAAEPGLTKFNLDFPGGKPKALVAAIEKAMDRPLNVIVPEELADTELPALKMNSVDVSQLFQALAAASNKSEAVVSSMGGFGGPRNYQVVNTSCGFRQGSQARPTDDTIWFFFVEKPVLPAVSSSAEVCRFYSLAPYVEHGLSVDDITTAIETGWKMLGGPSLPAIKYHKDTKLLIAVGDPSKLEIIDAALKALEPLAGGGGSQRSRRGIGGSEMQPPGPKPTPRPPDPEAK